MTIIVKAECMKKSIAISSAEKGWVITNILGDQNSDWVRDHQFLGGGGPERFFYTCEYYDDDVDEFTQYFMIEINEKFPLNGSVYQIDKTDLLEFISKEVGYYWRNKTSRFVKSKFPHFSGSLIDGLPKDVQSQILDLTEFNGEEFGGEEGDYIYIAVTPDLPNHVIVDIARDAKPTLSEPALTGFTSTAFLYYSRFWGNAYTKRINMGGFDSTTADLVYSGFGGVGSLQIGFLDEKLGEFRSNFNKNIYRLTANEAIRIVAQKFHFLWSTDFIEHRRFIRNVVEEREIFWNEHPSGERRTPSLPVMITLPSGQFLMGSPQGEPHQDTESPQHTVQIPYALAVGKYPITFDQWDACVKDGGTKYSPSDKGWGRGYRPVINVSWDDIQQYLRWLSKVTGKTYRLLSEAEWEYAARAGSQSTYSFGNDPKELDGYAWFKENSGWKTHPVGEKLPNAFGLYDMHGNVFEWTQDCWNENYSGAPTDGSAWTAEDCSLRVVRGGSYFYGPWNLRAAFRFKFISAVRGSNLGFRVARTD